jgi:hypothetical protein
LIEISLDYLTKIYINFVNLEVIWTNLNLHVRKPSCKYDVFWLSGSQRENFSLTSPIVCIFVIICPLKRNWSFICKILYSLYPRMIGTMFDWNWPAAWFWRRFVFNINKCIIMVFLLWPLPTPGDLDLKKFEFTLCQKAFVWIWPFLAQWFMRKKNFKWSHPIFVIIYPLKRNWSFIWTTQNPIYPRMICTKKD